MSLNGRRPILSREQGIPGDSGFLDGLITCSQDYRIEVHEQELIGGQAAMRLANIVQVIHDRFMP
jgi:hypothetical protein